MNDNKNIGKSFTECLQILTKKLALMQHGLDKNLRNDTFIHNKIVTACEDQNAFKNICQRPALTLSGLLSDLRSAAELYDRNSGSSTGQTLFVDRKYQKYTKNSTTHSNTRVTSSKKKALEVRHLREDMY
ncbi:hypothetical protein GcM1_078004 [Golovinomyces cichoracearum]|uniref:Uncharacterized protein n=1 Tax=Golovinomyces cichoracearum TaxID=62708 RepID=A0A420JCF5_9PEZI|nr:hypothetical protein GcM1_078004 [Golovinomyces cichoracearum]